MWTDSISSLPDSKFFDMMRLYLGEIETPYNKQRLIEQLAGFIKNERNSNAMLCFLDEFDIKLLTAIAFMNNATQETLIEFFSAEYTAADILSGISNLIARLWIFEQADKYSSKKYLRINPIVSGRIEKLLTLDNIIVPAEVEKPFIEDSFTISPDFIAAVISFINTKNCSCKNDGVVKKNTLSKITTVFAGREKIVQLLISALLNLSVILDNGKTLEIDIERLKRFAELESQQQYALLCAASCSRFSREGLKKEAQLLLDTISSVPQDGCLLSDMIRLGFITSASFSEGGNSGSTSRFSRMLEAARQESPVDPEQAGSLIDRMLKSAVEFGLVQKAGFDSQGNEIYIRSAVMENAPDNVADKRGFAGFVNIESTFAVSIMPGLSLKKLIPLMDFLEIKTYGVVSEYEITRHSVSVAFDKGWNVETICDSLQKYTSYDIPQNLKICISEWYDSYSSAVLYQGYVLKVDKGNVNVVENNPKINIYIKEKLAEGIYLLNIPVDADISDFIEQSGLDFMGQVKNPVASGERLPFPILHTGRNLSAAVKTAVLRQAQEPHKFDALGVPEKETVVPEPVEGAGKHNFSSASHLLNDLKKELKNLELNKNQRESLESRIRNRLILTKEQLAATSVRSEILEADGMDFNGKVHLFEAGLKENDMMEITLPQFDNENEYFKVLGHTLGITKQTGDAIVRFQVYPGEEITNFVVSRITYLRRLRF